MIELPEPDIRVDVFGDILPTDGRRFVIGDFYTASKMREHKARAFEKAAQLIERYPHWLGENAKREIAKALRSLNKGGAA